MGGILVLLENVVRYNTACSTSGFTFDSRSSRSGYDIKDATACDIEKFFFSYYFNTTCCSFKEH